MAVVLSVFAIFDFSINHASAAVNDPIQCSAADIATFNNENAANIRSFRIDERNGQNACRVFGDNLDVTANVAFGHWALGNNVAGGNFQLRQEGARFTNFQSNTAIVFNANTNTVIPAGTHTITYIDTDDNENRTFTITVNANGRDIDSISAITSFVPSVGPTESELLDDQQDQFTPLIINQQSRDLLTGVTDNLGGQFNGNGMASVVTTNGFAMSSTGLANWFDKRTPKMNDRTRKMSDLSPIARWNMWVKGTWTRYDGDGSSFDGDIGNIVGGVDYRLRKDLIVGLLGGYGIARFDTVTGGTIGKFGADGYTVGAYMGRQFSPSLTFDALVAYTASDYDNRVGATAGSFDANRITVAANLKGRTEIYGVTVEPAFSFLWASEAQTSYTDSAAVFHASQTVTAGRLSFGPKIYSPEIATGNAMTTFWLGAFGEYDFSNQGNSANTGLPDIDNVASVRLQTGLVATDASGIIVSLQGNLSGLGSGKYTAYGGTVKVTVPLN